MHSIVPMNWSLPALENGGADNVTVVVADVPGFSEVRENK